MGKRKKTRRKSLQKRQAVITLVNGSQITIDRNYKKATRGKLRIYDLCWTCGDYKWVELTSEASANDMCHDCYDKKIAESDGE